MAVSLSQRIRQAAETRSQTNNRQPPLLCLYPSKFDLFRQGEDARSLIKGEIRVAEYPEGQMPQRTDTPVQL